MNSKRYCLFLVLAVTVTACRHRESSEVKKEESVGITFKSGKGLRISDETKKIIGLEIVEASEQKLAAEFTVGVQVYGHGNSLAVAKSDGTNAYATGFVSGARAKELRLEQAVALRIAANPHAQIQGMISRLNPFTESALHETEVLIEIPDARQELKIGTAFETTFTAQETQNVTAIPRSAVLKTTEGTFAYVVNGDYVFRTAIKTGVENADFVEIKDGLYSGDQIVKQSVTTLWIAELQAIKGGADND
jgi:multidrug efflux pump subunit AcrA (membrane-fusion protein)